LIIGPRHAKARAQPETVCGRDHEGNKVCAGKRELEARLTVCGKDIEGNKVCAGTRDLEARLTVCGKDAEGNKVCAGKREELDARGITVSPCPEVESVIVSY
jgi:hypothetical protein